MTKKTAFAIAFMLLLLSYTACSNKKASKIPAYPEDTTVSLDSPTGSNASDILETLESSKESTAETPQEFEATDSEYTTASHPTTEVPESIQSPTTPDETTKIIETTPSKTTTKKTTAKSSTAKGTTASKKKDTKTSTVTSTISDNTSSEDDGVVILDDEDEVVILDDEDIGDDLLVDTNSIVSGSSSNSQEGPIESGAGHSGGSITDIGTSPTFLIERVAENVSGKTAVNVYVRNNPGITSIALTVSYDSALRLDSVVYNSSMKGETMLPQTMKNPTKLVWVSPFENVSGDFLLATLYFDTANVSTSGEYWISAAYNPDDVFNLDENNISFNVNNGCISVK